MPHWQELHADDSHFSSHLMLTIAAVLVKKIAIPQSHYSFSNVLAEQESQKEMPALIFQQ